MTVRVDGLILAAFNNTLDYDNLCVALSIKGSTSEVYSHYAVFCI